MTSLKIETSPWVTLYDTLANRRREILQAMPVPGGVLVRTEQRWGMGGESTAFSTCFVPNVQIIGSELQPDTMPSAAELGSSVKASKRGGGA